jgi:hypothetical protein
VLLEPKQRRLADRLAGFAGAALLGVAATLRKPFTADQLLDTVRSVLRPR